MSREDAIDAMLRRLERRVQLSPADRDAVASLALSVRRYEPGAYLVREGMPPGPNCAFVLSGVAYRQKLTVDGARQIVAVQLQGDFVDLQHLWLRCADHNVQALTRLEVAEVERERLRTLALENTTVGTGLWTEALVDASITREWVTNIGRRDARTRLLHLLCEYAVRSRAAGRSDTAATELPMTQEQLGDATGLTAVHVNRTLRTLEADGLVTRSKRFVRLADGDRAVEEADFNPRYLHLPEG